MGWIVGLVCCQQPLLGSLVDLLANLLAERAHPGQNKQTVSLSPHALAQPHTYLMAAPDRALPARVILFGGLCTTALCVLHRAPSRSRRFHHDLRLQQRNPSAYCRRAFVDARWLLLSKLSCGRFVYVDELQNTVQAIRPKERSSFT